MAIFSMVVALPVALGSLADGWTETMVFDNPDPYGNGFGDNSIAVDSQGHVHIAFSYDANDGRYERLMYASNESGAWVTTLVDGGIHVGFMNSIDVDSNGRSHIAYFDYMNYCLKYATNAGGKWVNETVDATEDTGWSISLAVDAAGNPHIAYRNTSINSNGVLSYAEKVGGSWSIQLVDIPRQRGQIGVDCSIVIDSQGYSHISYLKEQHLGYATNKGGSWANYSIDDTYGSGWGSSIAIDSLDHIHICERYGSPNPNTLKYVTDASGSWVNETVDANLGSGAAFSIVVDSNDHPIILWGNGFIATYTKTDSNWNNEYIDTNNVGDSRMVIDANDKLHVSTTYRDLYYVTNSIATDTTDPSISITSPTFGSSFETTSNSVTVSGTASDDTGVTSITWTNSAGGSGSASVASTWSVVIPLQQGSNYITVTAHDAASHTASDYITVTYTPSSIDTTNPTISIAAPVSDSAINNTSVTIEWAGSDNVGVQGYQYRIDGGSWSSNTTDVEHTFTGLSEGSHEVGIKAFDQAGNHAEAYVDFIIDTTAPEIQSTTPANGALTNSSSIAWTGEDDQSGILYYKVRVDNGTWSGELATPTYSFSDLADGSHWVQIRAFDRAGNSVDWFLSFTLDKTPPLVSITLPTSGAAYATNVSSLTVAGTSSDLNGIVEVKWTSSRGGSGAATVSGSNWSISSIALAEGSNTITIAAKDGAGNTAKATLTVDYTPDSTGTNGLDAVTISLIVILIVSIVLVVAYVLWKRKQKGSP